MTKDERKLIRKKLSRRRRLGSDVKRKLAKIQQQL
jgi:hypothetical protein